MWVLCAAWNVRKLLAADIALLCVGLGSWLLTQGPAHRFLFPSMTLEQILTRFDRNNVVEFSISSPFVSVTWWLLPVLCAHSPVQMDSNYLGTLCLKTRCKGILVLGFLWISEALEIASLGMNICLSLHLFTIFLETWWGIFHVPW